MKLDLALRELHRSEKSLAADLLKVADRHKVDHEIYHVARDLARWSQQHVHELAEIGPRYNLNLKSDPPEEAQEDSGLLSTVRSKASELVGRRPEPGLLLLADLRHLHRVAAGVSLDWELLGQGAQAAKDSELLGADQAMPSAVAAANAMGQRDAQGAVTSGSGELTVRSSSRGVPLGIDYRR